MDSNGTPTKNDIDGILKRKRKVREHKACYPCRSRKVRCNAQIPCQTCVERNHADLCTFNPPEKKQLEDGSVHRIIHDRGEDGVTIKKEDWERFCSKLSSVEKSLSELKHDLRYVVGGPSLSRDLETSPDASNARDPADVAAPKYIRAMEITEQSHLAGEKVHLGGASVPALVVALGKNNGGSISAVQEVFRDRVLPLFGLANESASYPFVSLWGNQGASARIDDLCKTLPGDADCLESFSQYRNGACHTYPALVEIDKFESELLMFLMNRRANLANTSYVSPTDQMHGMSLDWVALLFAVFASGAQFSTKPRKDRDLVSHVYVCCSFECLRLVNYIANASLEVVQTLLLLANILSNAMNAGVAWSLLGMTSRLAQSLGMHRACEHAPLSQHDLVRAKTWWLILWQDTLLSISYDRASCAPTVDCDLPPLEEPLRGGFSFADCMYRLTKVGLDTLRNRIAPQSVEGRLLRCTDLRDAIQEVQDQAANHCRDPRSCKSIRDQGEYWVLKLHASYMKAELCRPSLSPSIAKFDKSNQLRTQCIGYLSNTVEAFLGLANVNTVYPRTWAVIHRSISSALLLGLLGESQRSADVQDLLRRLIDVLKGYEQAEGSTPIAKSVIALHKLCLPECQTPQQIPPSNSNGILNANFTFEDGMSLNFDDSAFFASTPFSRDQSPYSLMDSIIWGGVKTTF